jgi:DnaJ domain
MNQFNRSMQSAPTIVFASALWTAALVVAFAIHIYVGLILLGLCVFWFLRKSQTASERWAHNVRGENAYQILGVASHADPATVRRAFRRLELEYHPDTVPAERKAEAEALFIRIGQAYELLSDREKRFQYDGLLQDLEGRIPPFAEAYEHIKDEHRHPIYADYDAEYGDRQDGPLVDDCDPEDVLQTDDENPLEATQEPASSDESQPASVPAPGPTIEVEIPAAVREALGLPAAAKRLPDEIP